MIKFIKKFAVVAVLAVSALSSCKKDDDTTLQEVNTIEVTAPLTVEPSTATVDITGRILEFPTKQIAKVSYYYIINSNDYAKRVAVESDFSRDASKVYFGNILYVTVNGEVSDIKYAIPYNEYDLKVTVPLASYNLVLDDYFYVGIEITATDGSKFFNTKRIDIQPEEEE